MVQQETKESIKEALEKVRDLNPDVRPKYAMVDFSHEEISALEETFDGIISLEKNASSVCSGCRAFVVFHFAFQLKMSYQ